MYFIDADNASDDDDEMNVENENEDTAQEKRLAFYASFLFIFNVYFLLKILMVRRCIIHQVEWKVVIKWLDCVLFILNVGLCVLVLGTFHVVTVACLFVLGWIFWLIFLVVPHFMV